jgi:hypothetical protein
MINKDKTNSIKELSEALHTLENFEKFMVNCINGRYANVFVGEDKRSQLLEKLDRTKLKLLGHVVQIMDSLLTENQ